jgi:hypothetical protein
MGCGCGASTPAELWQAYLPDGTVTEPMSKPAATKEAAVNGGYILQVSEAPAPEPVAAAAA